MGDENGTPTDNPKTEALTPQVLPPDPLALEVIHKRNEITEAMRTAAIRSTRPEHWTDHDGKPRLTSAGADVVRCRFGMSIRNKKWQRIDWEDEAGRAYQYIYTATFAMPGDVDVIEDVTGEASSRDAFLGTGLDPEDLKREVYEVKPGDILKKAESNLIQRGVTMLAALRGLTWETLAMYGVTKDGVTSIQYAKGAKGGGRGKEFTFGFGKQKGLAPNDEQVTPKDLEWYAGAYERSLGDASKAKYKDANEAALKIVRDEIARRTNAGQQGAQAKPWARVKALAADFAIPDDALPALVKLATGKANAKDLVDDDVAKVKAALEKAAAENDRDDVDFD